MEWGYYIFISIFISILLFIAVAYPAEKVITAFENTVVLPGGGSVYDVPAPWNMGYTDALFWMQIMYIVCTAPAILGTLILFLSTIRTQSYDIFGTDATSPDQLPLQTYTPPIIPEYKKGGLF